MKVPTNPLFIHKIHSLFVAKVGNFVRQSEIKAILDIVNTLTDAKTDSILDDCAHLVIDLSKIEVINVDNKLMYDTQELYNIITKARSLVSNIE